MKLQLWFAPLLLATSLACGAEPGVTKNVITLGQSVPLTGPGSTLAVSFSRGARLHFDRVNAGGGIDGRKIQLLTLDDGGDAQVTVSNTTKLLEHGVLALFGYYGSAQVAAAYPQIKGTETMMFAPMAAADQFRSAVYENVYNLRPGYAEEAAAITRQAETLGARKFGVLHAADDESLAALESTTRTMSGLGANLLATASVTKRNVVLSVGKVITKNPESVFVIGNAAITAAAVRELRAQGFRNTIYCLSSAGEALLADELGRSGVGVVVARVVPKSDATKVQIVRELMAEATEANIGRPNVYMLEGYIAARVFTEALRRTAKPEPNRLRLKKALDAMDNVVLGGFRVHFADDRVASRMVELSLIGSDGKIKE